MVRLVADVARRRNRDRLDDLAVVPGVFVEIDDRQKIGRDASLVSGPDVERLRRPVAAVMVIATVVRQREAHERPKQQSPMRLPDGGGPLPLRFHDPVS